MLKPRLELMAEKGSEAFRMSDIVERTGVTVFCGTCQR
jgi:hypothetical protein